MSEEVLMLAVKKGELSKLTILFEKYQSHLYNFFVRMTWDKELSADLTQNVFLRILKYRQSYREGLKFKSWIFQIARNVHSDHFRDRKLTVDVLDDTMDIGYSREKEEDERARDQELLLNRAMELLELQDKEILVLSKYQKLKYEQIADTLEISVASVKVRVHRSIKRLRSIYFELEKQSHGGR